MKLRNDRTSVVVLAFDLGRNVGTCAGSTGANAVVQTWNLPQLVGPMMASFEGKVRAQVEEYDPDVIAFERPVVPFGRGSRNTVKHMYTAFGQASVLLKIASQNDIVAVDYAAKSVRKTIVGSGKATSEQIITGCVKMGFSPSDDHSADAILVWAATKMDIKIGKFTPLKI